MKILVVSNDSDGLVNFRGLLLKSIIRNNCEVACIVPFNDRNGHNEAERDLKKLGCKLFFVKMERRGMNPVKDFNLFLKYKKILKSWSPQLVLTYTIKPNIYAGLVCRILKIPYVVNVTGLGTAFQNNNILRALIVIMYRQSLMMAKKVFFENAENRDIMVDFGIIPKERTYVLAGAGVDLDKFSYLDYPIKEEKIKFLFVGRIMKEKGIDELFFALEKLNRKEIRCTLDILGRFEEDYSEQLKRYENEGWLKYHGVQSDIRPYIKKCHCFVLPSWHEGMANTNLENAACGRPIITSRIHGCLEAVIEGQTGYLCESKDAESLYKTMKKFIDLPYEKKRQMGIEGRKHMESIFDKRKVVEETITVMEII